MSLTILEYLEKKRDIHPTTISKNESRIEHERNPIKILMKKHKREKKDFRALITGKVGNGKSSLSQNLAIYTDKRFTEDPEKAIAENVHFLAQDWIKAAAYLPTFSANIIDEGVLAAFNRSFMNPENIAMVKTFSTMRFKRFMAPINIPVIDSLDISLRKMCDILMICESQGRAVVYEIVPSKFGGAVFHNTIIDSLRWPMPPKKLWQAYEKKKYSVEGKEYKEYSSKLEAKAQQQKSDDILLEEMHLHDKRLYNDKDMITIVKVMKVAGVGKDRASRLKDKYIESYIEKNE